MHVCTCIVVGGISIFMSKELLDKVAVNHRVHGGVHIVQLAYNGEHDEPLQMRGATRAAAMA